MLLLIKYTLLYGIVLMLVALGGMFSEHSGIINIALEGIMVIGGVAGVLTLTMLPADMSPFLVVLISVLVAALAGMVYSLLLAFASINLKADQTIGGTALNLLATAIAVVIAKYFSDSGSAKLNYSNKPFLFSIGGLELSIFVPLGIVLLVISYVVLYKTRFGLRLRACGAGEDLHHLSQSGAGFRVPGVARLAQESVFHQLPGKLRQGFFQGDAFFQAVQGRLPVQFPGKGHIILYKPLQLFHVRGKGGVVKAAVNNVQIPYFVHDLSLLTVFTAILHQSSPSVNCPHGLPHFVEKCRKVLDIRRNCRKCAVFDERLFLFFLAKPRASWYSLFVAHGFS